MLRSRRILPVPGRMAEARIWLLGTSMDAGAGELQGERLVFQVVVRTWSKVSMGIDLLLFCLFFRISPAAAKKEEFELSWSS